MMANALRAWHEHRGRRRRARELRVEPTQVRVWSIEAGEWVALVDLLRDELARGWIPKEADIEAALAVVRGNAADGRCSR